jgi:hypothetical protein
MSDGNRNTALIILVIVLVVAGGLGLVCCGGLALFYMTFSARQVQQTEEWRQATMELEEAQRAMDRLEPVPPLAEPEFRDSAGASSEQVEQIVSQGTEEWIEILPQVAKAAVKARDNWVADHPEDVAFKDMPVSEIEKTDEGWHVVFEAVTLPGEPEGESHLYLHVHLDTDGKVIKVVRGPDEVS